MFLRLAVRAAGCCLLASLAAAQALPTGGTNAAISKQLSLSRQIRRHLTKPPRAAAHGTAFTRPANWVFIPETPGASRVSVVATGGDLNGDGLADVVIGDAAHGDGRGRVLVFYGAPAGLRAKPDAVMEGADGERAFGQHLQLLGDVDGDGFDDVLISHKTNQDLANVFRGSQAGLVGMPAWLVSATAVPIGDVNGDGHDDMAAFAADSARETGVQVFHGSPQGFHTKPDWTAYSEQRGSAFGGNIARAGDVNSDGYDDLLIGAMRFSGRLRDSGKAYLYLGSAQGLNARPAWTAEYPLSTRKDVDEAYEQFFGLGLGAAGDVNRDGFDDVIVGACFAEHGDLNEGLTFVYHGSRQGLSRTPDWWAESNHAHSLFGSAVAAAGDVNGDGSDDILIGLPQAADGQMSEGAAAVYHGSKAGLAPQPAWLKQSDHTSEQFGAVVTGAGDLNGDGYADVLVVGPNYEQLTDRGIQRCGRVVVAYGGPGGLPFSNSWSLEKPFLTALQQELNRAHQRFGSVVYWGPWLLVLAAVSAGFLTVQTRLRRRLAAEIEKNRALTVAQERTRLARDLHDELGGHLARLSESGETPGTSFAEAARGVATGIERTIWSLHPGHRSLSDLACGLTDLAENLLRDTAIRRRFDIPLNLPATELPAVMLDAVYRAAQEALTNVRKHSRATEIIVGLQPAEACWEVFVTDNGVGLPAEGTAPKAGLGLAGMAARLREVGGTWSAEANATGGVTIRLTFPRRR